MKGMILLLLASMFTSLFAFGQDQEEWYIFPTPIDELKDELAAIYSECLDPDTVSRSIGLIYMLTAKSNGDIVSCTPEVILSSQGNLVDSIAKRLMNERQINLVERKGKAILEYEVLIRFEMYRIVVFVGASYQSDLE